MTVGDDEISIPRDKMKVTIEELNDSAVLAGPKVDLDGHYVLEAHVVLENSHILDGMWTLYLRPESESS